jgi:hypothetical protein
MFAWRDVPGVDQEPIISDLKNWTIITQGDKSVLFGYRDDGSWRKSSMIETIEGEGDNITITTYSGRIYKLREQDKAEEINIKEKESELS